MQRYKLIIEYDGTKYCGFPKQPIAKKSIEGLLEEAVYGISQEKVKIIVSGRTDAGVHALSQVIHFDLNKNYEDFKVMSGLNYYLKNHDIAILSCEKTDNNFHARFNSKQRHYKYLITNRRARTVINKNRSWHVPLKLDVNLMIEASKYLIGTHDFSSFRHSTCQASSAIKTISKIEFIENIENEMIEIYVSGNSFLQHMVRNIVGTLSRVGLKKINPEKIKEILESKDRTKAGLSAPAHGLYFIGVDY